MSIITCFECGEKAILHTPSDEKNYDEHGLCPKCWHKAMIECSKASIESRLDMIIHILNQIKEGL